MKRNVNLRIYYIIVCRFRYYRFLQNKETARIFMGKGLLMNWESAREALVQF